MGLLGRTHSLLSAGGFGARGGGLFTWGEAVILERLHGGTIWTVFVIVLWSLLGGLGSVLGLLGSLSGSSWGAHGSLLGGLGRS